MFAASVYDLYKAHKESGLTLDSGLTEIAIGFVVSFIVALLVVRWLIRFIQTHGFQVFAWYRIVLGIAILALLNFA